MAATDEQKLEILLKHWVEHNEEHGKEFQKWAEVVKTSGNIEVHENMLRAIEKLREVNEYLIKASKKLRREGT